MGKEKRKYRNEKMMEGNGMRKDEMRRGMRGGEKRRKGKGCGGHGKGREGEGKKKE